MKIKPLINFHVPGFPNFEEGQEYDVPQELGEQLVNRGHAEKMNKKTKVAKNEEEIAKNEEKMTENSKKDEKMEKKV